MSALAHEKLPELVEDRVTVGGRELLLRRPPDPVALLDEEAFEHEEFMPYWAELWPSSIALAEVLARSRLEGARVLELGCGLGVPSIVAALEGAEVLATDWSRDAVVATARNAALNGVVLQAEAVRWDDFDFFESRGPWDFVIGSDLLYERRNGPLLLDLLPRLVEAGEVLLAEPGRPAAAAFFEAAGSSWSIVPLAERVYRLRRLAGTAPG